MERRIVIALDFSSEAAVLGFLDQLDPSTCRVKIGKELFTSCGPDLVRQVIARGFDVFLDLKFHDIPNTVAGACNAAADLGVWMINVHASGGRAMLEAARESIAGLNERPLLIGVTILTSLAASDLESIGMPADIEGQVGRLATLTKDCGLDGVVCSAAEAPILRARFDEPFALVTPGIRRPEDSLADQKRVIGPREAVENGSSYLVVGRPITQAETPVNALKDFNLALAGV